MKKRWYRRKGIKALLLVLGIVSVQMAAVSAGGLAGIASMGIYPFDSGTYAESRTFSVDMYTNAGRILHALNAEKFLGDGSGVIDLQEVSSGGPLSYENTSGLAYSTENLKQWAEEDWMGGETENILICTREDGTEEYLYFDEFEEKIKKRELKFDINPNMEMAYEYDGSQEQQSDAESEILEWLGNRDFTYGSGISDSFYGASVTDAEGKVVYTDIKNFQQYGFTEKYSPEGADNILEVLNENPHWQGKITEAYDALTTALNNAALACEAEDILEEDYRQGSTNLNYVFVDKSVEKVYTNVENPEANNYESLWERIREGKNCYMILSPEQEATNLKTTMSLSEASWKNMVESFCTDREDYVFAVWTDQDFEIPDFLSHSRDNYEAYAKWIPLALAGGVFSIVLFLFSISFLTAAVGRNNKDELVHLSFFDRWYTEIAALLVIGIWGIGMTGMLNFASSNIEVGQIRYPVLFSMLGVWTGIWFFTGWMSLVRRIKAKTLWQNSFFRRFLCCGQWLIRKIWEIFRNLMEIFSHNTGSRIKMTLVFGGFCFFQFVLCALLFSGTASVLLLAILAAADLAGLVYLLRKAEGREIILKGLKKITDGDLQYKIPSEKLTGEQKMIAEYINRIGEGLDAAVENSVKNERMKTELITNVSHDIKTPLTSIINYIDLLKREHPTDPRICGYLDILEEKAQRLKNLTEDVVEASKASTGNISLEMADLNFVELVHQVIGEFEERFQEKNLSLLVHFDEEEAIVCADGRRMWRVLENIFSNVSKYAMENTRVYAEIKVAEPQMIFSLKNISAQPMNISAEELTERFIRGDVSRNTEGSGLGLSIAKSLTELQGGEFRLYLDGDLFKVTIIFQVKEKE